MASDGQQYVVVYDCVTPGSNHPFVPDIHVTEAVRVGIDGVAIDSVPIRLFESLARGTAVASSGHDFLATTFHANEIIGRFLRADGAELLAGPTITLVPGAVPFAEPSVLWNGGYYFLAWRGGLTHVRGDGSHDPVVPFDSVPTLSSPPRPLVASNSLGVEIIVTAEPRGPLSRAVIYTADELTRPSPPPPTRGRVVGRR